MAIYKCKMCGGTLEVRPGESVCECEYCGTKQTIPSVMEENLQNLFNRANVLRMKAEFDKAAGIYERIVQADDSEAEAYWGLVLCKYGVEYVEDPATFQRIPTCHRTSYEAVTADADYRSAIEHADASQRQIYEAEAKTIDEIQKGILAVAKKESPYDVFICYKEADENGKRTVDSTIANDIYYQLTQEGFKVFYSAITLEDKLGEEYEPYIFSALNSAKVMLVLGTKPEYFTAVWVKNEWSRFLKFMQNDRSRTLIPCYRDMDAYELPEEFAHLQAQDMAKIGFISDIIRGIKKLIAKPEENADAASQQPQVTQTVVQGGNVSKDALVKRGNMALEDGEWDGAKDFFDQALNLDAECAAAYLGKALAENRAASLDGWARVVGPAAVKPHVETLQAGKPDTEAESRIVSENLVPGYLDSIRWEPFDFSFTSTKSGWVSARNSVRLRMEQNKNLNRAVQYGDAALRRQIDDCKKAILTAYDARITEAERQDEARKAVISKEYTDFLSHQEEIAGQQRQMAEENREEDYQKAVAAFNAAEIKQKYIVVRQAFADDKMKNYKDSAKYVEECTARIAELDMEEEREKAQRRAKKKKRTRIGIIVTICAVVVVVVVVVLATQVIIPSRNYNQAVAMLDDGQYEDAIEAFVALGSFKDSEDMIQEAQNRRDYETAEKNLDRGSYKRAIEAFSTLGDYGDAEKRASDAQRQWYETAESYLAASNYDDAIDIFTQLGDYKDSADKVALAKNLRDYETAEGLLKEGAYEEAVEAFSALGDYEDAENRVTDTKRQWYEAAESCMETGYYEEAIEAFTALGNYVDSDEEILDIQYKVAESYLGRGENEKAAIAFGKISGYRDARERSLDLWKTFGLQSIAVGINFSVAVKSDGTVVATGDNSYGQCDVSEWKDIIGIDCGACWTVGLKIDGTVVVTGALRYFQDGMYQYVDINSANLDTENAVYISCSDDYCLIKTTDGFVEFGLENGTYSFETEDWYNITKLAWGYDYAIGLYPDGTVIITGDNKYCDCDVSDWNDIISISADYRHAVGLGADGTVVATGNNPFGECDVENWTDIVAISAGGNHTVGLKANGTVVAIGSNKYGQCDVDRWTNIISIFAEGDHTVGLKSNGTVVETGGKNYDQFDTSGWTNVIAITAEDHHLVALRSDGTVVATGKNDDGQCDVSGWTDILVP